MTAKRERDRQEAARQQLHWLGWGLGAVIALITAWWLLPLVLFSGAFALLFKLTALTTLALARYRFKSAGGGSLAG